MDAASGQGLQEASKEVLAGPGARKAKVLRMRFGVGIGMGIDMNTDYTLEEIVKQFTVTRETMLSSFRTANSRRARLTVPYS